MRTTDFQGNFSHYDNDRSQKHPRRSNQSSYNSNSFPLGPANSQKNGHGGKPQNGGVRLPQINEHQSRVKGKDNPVHDYLARLPDPADCEPCRLAATEINAGMTGLLAKLESEEMTPEGDEEILHHAGALRRLLSARNMQNHNTQLKMLDEQRPVKGKPVLVPTYIERKLESAKDLPPLPPITEPHLEEQVFTHITVHASRIKGIDSAELLSYDRLEFIGDAYIELIATRLISSRLPQVDVPEQSHFREQLVRNDTLGAFSTAYGLPDRLKHGGHLAKSKAWAKIIADVFEAYVAAVVLSDPKDGFNTAEEWLTQLWTPQLLSYKEPVIENAKARDEIQRLVQMRGVKLEYRKEKEMEEGVNGVQKFFIGLYMTGWGYVDKWLGSGEGRNKAQASVYAAMDALNKSRETLNEVSKRKQELIQKQRVEEDERRSKEREELQKQADAGDESAFKKLAELEAKWAAIRAKHQTKENKTIDGALFERAAESDANQSLKKDNRKDSSWLEKIAGGDGAMQKDNNESSWLEKEKKRKEKREKNAKKQARFAQDD